MRVRWVRVLLLVCAVFLLAALRPALGQEGMASLSGRVTDPGGLAVVGAKVQAVNIDTNTSSSTETNDAGLYTLPGVKPGNYRIVVEKEGFKQIVRAGIDLHVADAVDLNFTLGSGYTARTRVIEPPHSPDGRTVPIIRKSIGST